MEVPSRRAPGLLPIERPRSSTIKMPVIRIDKLTLTAGQFTLQGVSFEVPTGSYGVLMGRTGSGKTTILESIIGLRKISAGRIVINDREVTALKPALRDIGYVPQDGALFTTMTVRDQLSLALWIRKIPAEHTRQRVAQLAAMLQIEHLLDRKPRGLSGGERQRVALGRALSFRPPVLCLDEPFSALDEETRQQMCELLAEVKQVTGATILHVTHNPLEARTLADHVFRLQDGQVERTIAGELPR
jgi:molybdate/tungstate transport system ATP-binding protein